MQAMSRMVINKGGINVPSLLGVMISSSVSVQSMVPVTRVPALIVSAADRSELVTEATVQVRVSEKTLSPVDLSVGKGK
jgi:hypothetical protein